MNPTRPIRAKSGSIQFGNIGPSSVSVSKSDEADVTDGSFVVSESFFGLTSRRVIRAERGQVGPCLTDEAHRPLPERRPYVSRYAGARTLQKRSLRQILQVESSCLLCLRPTQLLAYAQKCVLLPNLSRTLPPNLRAGEERVPSSAAHKSR